MSAPPLYAVILAGGSGTRFWPASRKSRPKQFLSIGGGQPMLRRTLARLEGQIPPERVLVVTAGEQERLVHEALPELPAENVIREPEGRNTAPCIALAARVLADRAPDSVQVILPADHVIEPAAAFQRSLAAAVEEAVAQDVLVTFGIRPSFPATGYGYIECGSTIGQRDGIDVFEVERFVEKPDARRAQEFLASGRFLWNSGMFVWRARTLRAAYASHLPEILEPLQAWDGSAEGLERAYGALPAVPVDVGIFERASNVRMLPIDYAWSDVGSWAAIPDVVAADGEGNFPSLANDASVLSEDARNCVVHADNGELVALLGVEDLVVVRAGNATLVCPRDRAQDVKRLVDRLRSSGGKRFL